MTRHSHKSPTPRCVSIIRVSRVAKYPHIPWHFINQSKILHPYQPTPGSLSERGQPLVAILVRVTTRGVKFDQPSELALFKVRPLAYSFVLAHWWHSQPPFTYIPTNNHTVPAPFLLANGRVRL